MITADSIYQALSPGADRWLLLQKAKLYAAKSFQESFVRKRTWLIFAVVHHVGTLPRCDAICVMPIKPSLVQPVVENLRLCPGVSPPCPSHTPLQLYPYNTDQDRTPATHTTMCTEPQYAESILGHAKQDRV